MVQVSCNVSKCETVVQRSMFETLGELCQPFRNPHTFIHLAGVICKKASEEDDDDLYKWK